MYVYTCEVEDRNGSYECMVFEDEISAKLYAQDIIIRNLNKWGWNDPDQTDKYERYCNIVQEFADKNYAQALFLYNNVCDVSGDDDYAQYFVVRHEVKKSIAATTSNNNSTMVNQSCAKEEKPCSCCGKMNYLDVNECWCCGNKPW